MKRVKVFAASTGTKHGGRENFGDALMSPLLAELYGCEAVYTSPQRADLIGVGSILDAYHRRTKGQPISLAKRRPWRTLHVWGSGFMDRSSDPIWPQRVVIHAVRGPLTRARFRPLYSQVPLGDPAILLPLMWPKPVSPRSEVVIVPHFVTHGRFIDRYASLLPKHWKVLDLLGDPKEIALAIAAADFVVSSSLHGIIVADAYGVPSVWISPHGAIKGDGFKFADHAAFMGRPVETSPIDFEAFLASPRLWMSEASKPDIPKQATTALLESFPFR